jgi:2-dehydro-3-deoxyphosphogluconate aldolase/(4S)-4-hydroxy-2-oxoglutarate aldolase
MARFDRLSVYNKMIEIGMIPVFYHADFEVAKNVVAACSKAGAKVIEFTNRGDFAFEVFGQLVKYFAKEDPSVILGVGSIVDAPTAALYIANGTNFVVGPLLNAEVARMCNRRKVGYCPGCGSASEIGLAEELGCEIVKVFPGEAVGGPSFVKGILGPCPWTRIMPTGGVDCTEESLTKWFKAGIVCAGMGSNLITGDLVKDKDYAGIEKKVADTLALVRQIRGR